MTKAELIKEIEQFKDMQILMNKRLMALEVGGTSAAPTGSDEMEAVLEIARVRAAGIDLEAYLRQRARKRRTAHFRRAA